MKQTKKILIVEDEELTLQMYKEAFLKKGYYLFSARHKKEAMKKIKKEKPFIVILDLLIPSEKTSFESFDLREPVGLCILKEIKNQPEFSGIKVIVLTALDNESVKIASQGAGADAYYIKTEMTPGQFADKVIAMAEEG